MSHFLKISALVASVVTKAVVIDANAFKAEMNAFTANIEPINGNSISGTAVVITMADGSLFYGGALSGLEPNLFKLNNDNLADDDYDYSDNYDDDAIFDEDDAIFDDDDAIFDGDNFDVDDEFLNDDDNTYSKSILNCMAENGCGFHIHSGKGCEDSTAQGGHLYENLADDPWQTAKYSSDGNGKAVVGDFIRIGTTNVAGRAFVVHAADGSRIGCGILKEDLNVLTSSMTSLSDKAAQSGGVMTVGLGKTTCFAGSASGLSANSICNPTDTANGCGAHIHSGTACDTKETQSGHWFETTDDPWKLVGYTKTDENGQANFGDCVFTGALASEALSKPFIVHEQDGSRAICGLLKSNTSKNLHHAMEFYIFFIVSIMVFLLFTWHINSRTRCLNARLKENNNRDKDPEDVQKTKENDHELL